jgi:hypothetical protein
MVEDLDRRPVEPWRDAVRDLSEQHDARHGDVVGRDAAEPGQQLVGADELPAFQPPSKGDKQLAASCSVGVRRSCDVGMPCPPGLEPLSRRISASYA